MIRHIQPKLVPESAAPFSQVVMDDTYAHFAGLVAADFPEGQAVLGDVGEETRVVLTAIRNMLEEIGIDMDRIVRTDVHLASLEDFDAMDDAYRELYGIKAKFKGSLEDLNTSPFVIHTFGKLYAVKS